MLRVTLGETPAAGRRLAAKVEIYRAGARAPRVEGELLVEEPVEIAADKTIACLDRLVRRGFIKTFDLYDLDYLLEREPELTPPGEMLTVKAGEYGADTSSTAWEALDRYLALPSTADDLERDLASVLPATARTRDAATIVARVRAAFRRWRTS
jgi:hypothetical protein